MAVPDHKIYFYSTYIPSIRHGVQGLISAVCASDAKEALRKEFPESKYLNVHRVPELKGVFNAKTGNWDVYPTERSS